MKTQAVFQLKSKVLSGIYGLMMGLAEVGWGVLEVYATSFPS